MSLPNIWLLLAGYLVSHLIGVWVGTRITRSRAKRAERKAYREVENLYRARSIQDLRDNTRAF